MFNISFSSTYRIPITQAGVNNAKKEKLRALVESYPNGSIGKSKTGYARVSVPQEMDNQFESKLKGIGYRVFQKFDVHDMSKEDFDIFIKEKLDTRDYQQKGKKKKKMPRDLREQRRFERRYTPPVKNVENKEDINIHDDIVVNSEPRISHFHKPDSPARNDNIDKDKIASIKQTKEYLRIKDTYGEEFADALYFGIIE